MTGRALLPCANVLSEMIVDSRLGRNPQWKNAFGIDHNVLARCRIAFIDGFL